MTDHFQTEVEATFEYDDARAQWDRLSEVTKREILKQGDAERRESTDDRAMVIIRVVDIENALRQLLAAFMVEDGKEAKDLLEGESAPLGTFSAKIKAAYFLGLIDKETYRDLNLLRRIRNEFAHGELGMSCEESPIKDWIRELSGLKLSIPEGFEFVNIPRAKFDFVSSRILSSLKMTATRVAVAEKRATLHWLPVMVPLTDSQSIVTYADYVSEYVEAFHKLHTAMTQEEMMEATSVVNQIETDIRARYSTKVNH